MLASHLLSCAVETVEKHWKEKGTVAAALNVALARGRAGPNQTIH
jgi:hypothetical protein